MNLKTIKTANEIKLAGYYVEAETVNDSLNAIVIRDEDGALVAKFCNESYSFRALVPAPPKMVKRHNVSGNIHGITVNEVYSDVYEANRRASVLNDSGGEVAVNEIEITQEAADAAENDQLVF